MRNEIIQFTGCPDYFVDPRITEFDNFSGPDINEMVMLAALICFFELGYIFTELMFYYKAAVKEDFNSVIKSCPAHPVILVFHENIKRFYVKMSFP